MARISRGVVDDGSSGLSVDAGLTVSGTATVGGTLDVTGATTVTGNLIVTGSVGGVSPGPLPTIASLANTSTTLSVPGYYRYSGGTTGAASACTGTMPSAADFPGASFIFAPTLLTGGGMYLTGSAPSGSSSVFTFSSGSFIAADVHVVAAGGKMTLPNSGTVILQSNGLNWMHIASTGIIKLAV